jgi:hypothetical protein
MLPWQRRITKEITVVPGVLPPVRVNPAQDEIQNPETELSRVREEEFQRTEDWGWLIQQLKCWRRYLMCYSYSNLESVIIICTYNVWVSNKSIHQSKPRLQVTNTLDNKKCLLHHILSRPISPAHRSFFNFTILTTGLLRELQHIPSSSSHNIPNS